MLPIWRQLKLNEKKTPFTYINLINDADHSDIVVDDSVYNQFLTNRGMSLYIDTIAVANEINKYGGLSNQMHFDYYRFAVSRRKRWSKWPKPKDHGAASTISTYYQISMRKAYDMVGLFTDQQIETMKEQLQVE